MKIIYKIEDKTNGKIYIGKTTKTLDQRFLEHKKEAIRYVNCLEKNKSFGYKTRLYPAITEHGIKNFKISIIEVLNDSDNIDEKEKYYINKFNTTDSTIGYNISIGGSGGPLFTGHTQSEYCKKTASLRFKGKKQNKNFIEKRVCKHRIKVQNLNTGDIFSSAKEAENQVKEKQSTGALIHWACKYKRKAYNCYWIKLPSNLSKGYSKEERENIIEKYIELELKRKEDLKLKLKLNWANKSEVEKEKIKQNISQKLKGRIITEETRQKLAKNRIGKKHTEKTIEKLKNYYKVTSSDILKLRNKRNSEGQKNKKRYENIITKKHKMFKPEEVPVGWVLLPGKGGRVPGSKKYINVETQAVKYFKETDSIDLTNWKRVK